MVTLRDGKRVGGEGTSSVEPPKKKIKATISSTKASTSAKPAVKATNGTKKPKNLSKPKDEINTEAKEAPPKPAAKSPTPNPESIESAPNDPSKIKDEEASKPQTPTKTPILYPRRETLPLRDDTRTSPKGKKVRKAAQEKDDEYDRLCLETPGHTFHELHVCYEKGPGGSPTYDKAGFELDYKKVANWMQPTPYNKSAMVNGMSRHLDRVQNETARMVELFMEPGAVAPDEHHGLNTEYWKDRVSKDLGIPWHKIGVPEFEKWDRMGFPKAKRGDYQDPTPEERSRMLRIMGGASLRK